MAAGGEEVLDTVFRQFMNDQRARLRPSTYDRYDDAMYALKAYLNTFGYRLLDESDLAYYRDMFAPFLRLFSVEKFTLKYIRYFMIAFAVEYLPDTKTMAQSICTLLRRLVRWMADNELISDDDRTAFLAEIDEHANDLIASKSLIRPLREYIADSQYQYDLEDQSIDGLFEVVRIEPGKLRLRAVESGSVHDPVLIPERFSDRLRPGWTLSVALGRSPTGWRLLGLGNIYLAWSVNRDVFDTSVPSHNSSPIGTE